MKSLNLTKPHIIVVVGIPGSGKTFFARQFADTFNAPYLRSDDLAAFTESAEAGAKLWEYLVAKLLQTKQTIIVEGPGATNAERRQLASIALKHGYQTLYVWVQTEPSTALQRATKGDGKQKPEFPLTEQEFREQAARFELLQPPDTFMVISGKHTYASQAKNVLKKLAEPRTAAAKLSLEQRGNKPRMSSGGRGKITIG